MKKPVIVIASVLKPVTDTRMYEKFALSFSQTNEYVINIIGFWAKSASPAHNITFHPLFHFKRLQVARLFAPWRVLKRCLQLRPHLLIINTHELLIMAACYKLFSGAKVVYDVRENYYRNLKHTTAFPPVIKHILSGYVRAKEYLSKLYIDHYILAEKGYAKELTFTGHNYTVIENKYHPMTTHKKAVKNANKIQLIFTGTLARTTGVFEAVRLTKLLHEKEPKVELKIIGFCAQPSVLKALKKEIKNVSFITLLGGEKSIPHEMIIDAIRAADFGVISYPKNKSIDNTIPTKLYEYLALHIPLLLTNYDPWITLADRYHAGIYIDFDSIDSNEILARMASESFYTTTPGSEVLWSSEATKLLQISKLLISNN